MAKPLRIANEPHRLEGPLSAHLAELGRRFVSVSNLQTGMTQDDVERVIDELNAACTAAKELEREGAPKPPVTDHLFAAETAMWEVRLQMSGPVDRRPSPEVAAKRIETAISQLVAARAEILASNPQASANGRAA